MKRGLRQVVTAGVVLGLAVVTGCGTGGNTPAGGQTGTKAGKANVAYAGSLQLVNDSVLGPAFTKATGIAYQGRGGGSFGVAHLIASGEISPNVFESIGTAPYEQMGNKKATWAVGFASSPIVVAYSPSSPYAAELKAIAEHKKPLSDLFTLMEKPGFHLGRTNPETDPQGQAFILMMHLAEQQLHLPAGTANKILGPNDNASQVFAEEAILSRLQSGQLDATSAYLPQAVQHHLPYITLPASMNLGDPAEKATYASAHMKLKNGKEVTGSPIEVYVTTVPGATNQQEADKFVAFLLSKQGRDIYKKNGFTLTPFLTWGNASDIPTAIRTELKG